MHAHTPLNRRTGIGPAIAAVKPTRIAGPNAFKTDANHRWTCRLGRRNHPNNAKERKKLELMSAVEDRARKYRESNPAVKTKRSESSTRKANAEAGKKQKRKTPNSHLDAPIAGLEVIGVARLANRTVIAAKRNQIKAHGIEQKKELEPRLLKRE